MNFDTQAIIDAVPYLKIGLLNTVFLSVLGIVLSSALGILFALLRISRNPIIKWLLVTYIEIFRNTPIVAQIFYLYFALPLMGIKVSAFNCGLIALVLHFSAYNIEVFRSGLEAVPYGLNEASESLGFTHLQKLKLVVLPLALRFSLPALANNYVSLLKHTAYVSVIGVAELTYVAQSRIADSFVFMEMYSLIAVLYLVLVFGLTWLLRMVERRYAIEF